MVSASILKNRHMASLLGFHSYPSRTALLSDLHHRNLLKLALPEIALLHENLEVLDSKVWCKRTLKLVGSRGFENMIVVGIAVYAERVSSAINAPTSIPHHFSK
jgi:hypothetical protein